MIVTCPYCRDPLEIAEDLAARPVRCGACRAVFTPVPDDAPDDTPDLRSDGPRRRTRPSPPPPGVSGAIGLLLLTLLLASPCVGGCVWGMVVLMLPPFESRTDAAGRFTAAFPGPAVASTRLTDDGTGVSGLEFVREVPPERYGVYYFTPKQPARPGTEAKALSDAAADLGGQVAPGADEFAREEVTHDGHPALDVRSHYPPGELIVRAVYVRVAGRPDQIYVAAWAGSGGPQDVRVRRFFTAFRVTD